MKRFTETQKWEDAWYRKLSPIHKLLWQWICDKCDQAGVIEPDWDLASFQIGSEVTDGMLAEFGPRIAPLPSGKLHVVRFIQFQYGKLSRSCKPHMPVYAALERHGMSDGEVQQNEQYTNTVDGYVRKRIIARDGLRCVYYDKPISEDEAVIDHVTPRVNGGTATDDNLVVASARANQKKWDYSVEEFCRREGLDLDAVSQRLSEATGKPIEAFREPSKGYLGSLKEKEKVTEKVTEKGLSKARGSLDDLIAFCVSIDLPQSDGEYVFHKWEGNGWTNSGKPIKDWAATIRQWKVGKFLPSQKAQSAQTRKPTHSNGYNESTDISHL